MSPLRSRKWVCVCVCWSYDLISFDILIWRDVSVCFSWLVTCFFSLKQVKDDKVIVKQWGWGTPWTHFHLRCNKPSRLSPPGPWWEWHYVTICDMWNFRIRYNSLTMALSAPNKKRHVWSNPKKWPILDTARLPEWTSKSSWCGYSRTRQCHEFALKTGDKTRWRRDDVEQ